ncbi:MAG: hypothetical protein JNM67_00205 [Bacteroidetes bacterium]|nr:hypothetical protein [Bacteroidota bacterium]
MKLNLLRISLLALSVVHFCACNKQQKKKEEVLAEFKGKMLYRTDIPEDIWSKFREGDSTGLLKSYIDKWLENQVLVDAAEVALSESEKDKEKLIEDYRNSLLIYEYEQKLMREKIDTTVTEEEIKAFYEENLSTFQLRKNIVKIKYIKVNKQKADVPKLRKWMQNPSDQNDLSLLSFAEKEADNFYLDSNWLYLDDIAKEIPLDANYDQQRFLSNNKFVQLEENNTLYLLYIIDFRIKNAISPIEFEKDKIRDIIIHKRRLDMLKNNTKSIFEKALNSGDIKYHQIK